MLLREPRRRLPQVLRFRSGAVLRHLPPAPFHCREPERRFQAEARSPAVQAGHLLPVLPAALPYRLPAFLHQPVPWFRVPAGQLRPLPRAARRRPARSSPFLWQAARQRAPVLRCLHSQQVKVRALPMLPSRLGLLSAPFRVRIQQALPRQEHPPPGALLLRPLVQPGREPALPVLRLRQGLPLAQTRSPARSALPSLERFPCLQGLRPGALRALPPRRQAGRAPVRALAGRLLPPVLPPARLPEQLLLQPAPLLPELRRRASSRARARPLPSCLRAFRPVQAPCRVNARLRGSAASPTAWRQSAGQGRLSS